MIMTRVSFTEDPWMDRMKENKLVAKRKAKIKWKGFFLFDSFKCLVVVVVVVFDFFSLRFFLFSIFFLFCWEGKWVGPVAGVEPTEKAHLRMSKIVC